MIVFVHGYTAGGAMRAASHMMMTMMMMIAMMMMSGDTATVTISQTEKIW
jgi:hypothetical protein